MKRVQKKIDDNALDACAMLSAQGFNTREIVEKLAKGAPTNHHDLVPIFVTYSTVRQRLQARDGRQRLQAWRMRLFGDVYSVPIAFAAERLRRLQTLCDDAGTALLAAGSTKEAAALRVEIRGHVAAAQTIAAGAAVEATLTADADASGQGQRAEVRGSLESLAEHLAGLDAAGVLALAKIGEG